MKTDGTERLCINSDGDIAFGITDPQLTRGVQISKGGGFQDAPTSYSLANEYLHLGEGEYGDNSNGGLFTMGFGYSEGTTNGPAYLGYQETSTNGSTNGALIFATRGDTTDIAPTERLRITDSGTVEIRKNAPQIKFIDTDDTSGNTHTQLIHDGAAFYVDIRNGANNGQLVIRGQGGGTSTEVLRIDDNGYMTRPNTPAFTTNEQGSAGSANSLNFINPSARINNGSHYNSSNGRFTAPIAGTYLFYFSCTMDSSTSSPVMYFHVNGTKVGAGMANYSVAYNGSCMTQIFELSASDYVNASMRDWNGTIPDPWSTWWGGYLLY